MKKIWLNKEFICIAIIAILFVLTSIISLTSMHQMQGNARVINYVGIVRGATQKLVKEELMGYHDDALIGRLEGIITNLTTGVGEHDLTVLHDEKYLNNMRKVRIQWDDLKLEIENVRNGGDAFVLFDKSQSYFNLVDQTVFAAESFSEKQVKRNLNMLIGFNLLFLVLIIAGFIVFIMAITLKKRADLLSTMAFIDPLTKINNRAGFKREIDKLKVQNQACHITVFMFDMNNLKLTNDFLGHEGGDRILMDFTRILQNAVQNKGFVSRFGGDEFVVVFISCNGEKAETYLDEVNLLVGAYNALKVNEIEKISFAEGHVSGVLDECDPDEMVNLADHEMYRRKHEMKLHAPSD